MTSTRSVCSLLSAFVLFAICPCFLAAAEPMPEPVDDSMHHFMEYFFEPAYKRLKVKMAEAAPDRATWKAVKGDALTLGEGTNLLMHRGPDEGTDKWMALSVKVREQASLLYQAARKQDAKQASTSYRAMISNCNACHKAFADGKYQLKP